MKDYQELIKQIRSAYRRIRRLSAKVPSDHKRWCDVLVGSRASDFECNCGVYAAEKELRKAEAEFAKLMKG